MNNMLPIALGAIAALGILMLFILFTTKRKSGVLNVEEFRVEWLKIMNSLDNKNTSTFELALINADKLLDKALKDLDIQGVTMAERLKFAGSRFSSQNNVWSAHKLRNRVAHDHDHQLKIVHARRALAIYKRALRDLGAV